MAIVEMSPSPVLRMVDAVTVPVPDLDQGLAFTETASVTT